MPTEGGQFAIVPDDLPPRGFVLDNETATLLGRADNAVGRLQGTSSLLLNPCLIGSTLLQREAILSSRIEGTHTTPEELATAHADEVDPSDVAADTREVQNYIDAMNTGIKWLENRPLDLKAIRELHRVLMRDVRGRGETPGRFRTVQNFIGTTSAIEDARFVPPPPIVDLDRCLHALEMFIHVDARRQSGQVARADVPPLLVRVAMIHNQFETIHPFRDGNGRVGRLLIPLLLLAEDRLTRPTLYMSAYFERNRASYYDRMLAVSQRADWRGWVTFFLRGVLESAGEAEARSQELLRLRGTYHERLRSSRSTALLFDLVDQLFHRPAITRRQTERILDVVPATASASIRRLVEAEILVSVGKRGRTEVFLAPGILSLVKDDPPPG